MFNDRLRPSAFAASGLSRTCWKAFCTCSARWISAILESESIATYPAAVIFA